MYSWSLQTFQHEYVFRLGVSQKFARCFFKIKKCNAKCVSCVPQCQITGALLAYIFELEYLHRVFLLRGSAYNYIRYVLSPSPYESVPTLLPDSNINEFETIIFICRSLLYILNDVGTNYTFYKIYFCRLLILNVFTISLQTTSSTNYKSVISGFI